jgi:hypothetical protein
MRLKVLTLVVLIFFAAFTTCSAIAVVRSEQVGGSLGLNKASFLAYASNDTTVIPNGPIDTPGGPT